MYIPEICDIIVLISFGKCFKSFKKKLYSKLSQDKILEKLLNRFIFFTATDKVEKYVEMIESGSSDNYKCHFNVKILNYFDPELQLIDT